MKLLRSITRYVPRWGLDYLPCGHEVQVNLCQGNAEGNPIVIITPWACLNGSETTTDAQMIAALATSFATLEEAEAYAKRRAPFAGQERNEEVREEVLLARQYYGSLGAYRVADKYDLSYDAILAVARGERKAPRAKVTA